MTGPEAAVFGLFPECGPGSDVWQSLITGGIAAHGLPVSPP